MQQPLAVFLDHFSGLEDSRETGKVLHPVPEILLVTLCGVIAGAEGFEDIEDYGESKLDLLRELLPFANGIPSDDTLRRFFRAVDPRAFAEVFVAFARDVFPEAAQRLIAIDGKTLRRSHDGTAKALHLVSAFATEARLVLAQVATAEKSNEITAIPELLRLLDLRGATVSIDAMGCQREIAAQIVEGGGHYLLGLKGNQGLLHDDVRLFFKNPPEDTNFATHEASKSAVARSPRIPVGFSKDTAGLTSRASPALPPPASSATKPALKHASISPTIAPTPHASWLIRAATGPSKTPCTGHWI
jgi:predicted transposase YbfD/YdcC